jgi:hypothetical protein
MSLVAGKVEPVTDFETKRQKADGNGEPIWAVELVAFGDEGPQIWPVKVSGEPRGLAIGQPVKVGGPHGRPLVDGGPPRHQLPGDVHRPGKHAFADQGRRLTSRSRRP